MLGVTLGGCPATSMSGGGARQLLFPARDVHCLEHPAEIVCDALPSADDLLNDYRLDDRRPTTATNLYVNQIGQFFSWNSTGWREPEQQHEFEPFVDDQVRQGVMLLRGIVVPATTSASATTKVFTTVYNTGVDPKNCDPKSFVDNSRRRCIIPRTRFALASTIEYVPGSRANPAVCLGKLQLRAAAASSSKRDPLRDEGEGHVTIEISNTTSLRPRSTRTRASPRCLLTERRACSEVLQGRKAEYQAQPE